jgi:hypothetical protein
MQKNTKTKHPNRDSGEHVRALAPHCIAQDVARLWTLLREADAIARRIPSDEMHAAVQKLSGEFYALGSEALDAIRYELDVRKDGRLGYQVLKVMGVIPCQKKPVRS